MKRPWEITFLGGLFLLGGVGGLVADLWHAELNWWLAVMVAVQGTAIVGAVFLMLGRGWARWLLLVWLAVHVVIGGMGSLSSGLAHAVLLLVVAYFLLKAPAAAFFRQATRDGT